MSTTSINVAAALIALPILGFVAAPRIFVEPQPSVFCDETAGAAAELNGEPAIVFRLCDSPYLIVVPGVGRLPVPGPDELPDEPQFTGTDVTLPVPPVEENP